MVARGQGPGGLMKFGMSIGVTENLTLRNPWDAVYRQASMAEEAGFDMLTAAHHRFTQGYDSASTWTVLAALAARTERIRLGTNIYIVPLDHPLDTAEQIATVDRISHGRVFLGAGLGYQRYEFDALGLPYNRRGQLMTECLEIIQRAWAEERISYEGNHFHFDDVEVLPKPVQSPRPPIYVGANSEAGIRRAARLADGYLVPFPDPLPKVRETLAWYRAEAAANGRQATVVLGRQIGIASTRQAVEEQWLPRVLQAMRAYRRAGAPTERNEGMAAKLKAGGGKATITDLGNDVFIAGTPDDVIAGLKRAEEMTACEVVLGTPSGPDADEAWRLFTQEVMPVFAGDSPGLRRAETGRH
jgi:probable F420-dependent oxidoreductase